MSRSDLSRMIDLAAEVLMDHGQPVAGLPRRLAGDWPDAPALEYVLAICSACEAIEQMYRDGSGTLARVREGWRQAAVIGAEVHALQHQGLVRPVGADLLAYWQGAVPR